MKINRLLLLGIALAAVPYSNAAILLDRTGTINAQCCQFDALAIGWTMDREWTNVKIELDLHNAGDEDEIHTGVALLLNSIGPGTTEAVNEIDDVVVAEGGAAQKTVTLFQGLTLGPGSYYVVYYRVSYDFPHWLSVAWDTNMDSETMGVGIVALPTLIEDENAPYRPASTWSSLGGSFDMIHITGTPSEDAAVPEPSTASLLLLGAAAVLPLKRLQRKQ
jgi:hypothetical protein